MSRRVRCPWHDAAIPASEAVLVGAIPRTSGPDEPVYACRTCVETSGILPLAEHPKGSTGQVTYRRHVFAAGRHTAPAIIRYPLPEHTAVTRPPTDETPLTIRGYLDAPLGVLRVRDLEQLAARFTGRPLADTVADLRTELTAGIDRGGFHRLNILISHLYHRCGADLPLTERLRAEVSDALAHGREDSPHPADREEVTGHVLPD